MPDLVLINARILTLAGPADPRRGGAMRDLGVIERGYVTITDGRIEAVASGDYTDADPDDPDEDILDVSGCVVMPAFVDCHTHACWAGSRLGEFQQSVEGASYLDILNAGGGIMSTVRATREATVEQLYLDLLRRLGRMTILGSGAIEVKSGYGLNTEAELKMLRAIHAAAQVSPALITGTFLGAHAIDPDNPDFIEETITETLPTIVDEFPEIVCDAYCEEGAWSFRDTVRLFEAAKDLGCPIRVHTDQFNSLGMTSWAIDAGAVSVDHLEAIIPGDIRKLADSSTIGVALPCSGFHLDERYAPARELVDQGGALAIASNCNPGSAPTPSMPFTIALACRKLKLTPAEAIIAATHNAACVLNIQHMLGSIAPGMRANLQVLDTEDERELGWQFADPGPLMVILNGLIEHIRDRGIDDSDNEDHDVDLDFDDEEDGDEDEDIDALGFDD